MPIAQPGDIDRLPSSDQLICDDGEPMESGRHWDQMVLLIKSLRYAWRERTDFFVGGNMFLYFSEAQVRSNDFRGPDVFVVMNTTRRERKAWVLWEEGFRTPNVIIELLSDTTEHVDRGEKKDIYEKTLKIPEYVLFDPFSGTLDGYELDEAHGIYVRKLPDKHGRLRCTQLGLSLATFQSTLDGVEADWLRWVGPDGQPLPLAEEDANTERQRADDAAKRADDAAKRADDAAKRADDAAKRADDAIRRAEDAQEREGAARSCAQAARSCARELLLSLLPVKFGPPSDQVQERIAQASTAQLRHWSKRVRTAGMLRDVFADEQAK